MRRSAHSILHPHLRSRTTNLLEILIALGPLLLERLTMLVKLYEFADLLRHHRRKRHMTADHALGRRGEDVAHRFLQRAGFVIVDRNYRMASGSGEVDLIGWEGEMLVFVEVKSRTSEDYGAPDRAVGPQKQSSLIRAAREYARHAEVPWEGVRFDVLNVVFTKPLAVTHFRDVFGGRRANG
jgi:putative endonuclease